MAHFQADYGRWPAYVPVAERRRRAAREVAARRQKGARFSPVVVTSRSIATTFWGRAWCTNLESYSDYASRLPRGRTYVRSGAVVDLQIAAGELTALVMGSQLYDVRVTIRPIAAAQWQALIRECAGRIDSLIELLQGKLARGVMELLTRPHRGLFPEPRQIELACSCPDAARLCKHVAAALYGVGARLDEEPELLFRLRHVDQLDLITGAGAGNRLDHAAATPSQALAGQDLSALFGIELDGGDAGGSKSSHHEAASPRVNGAAAGGKSAAGKKSAVPTRVTRKQLLALGISPSTLQAWLRSGALLASRDRGIYQTTPLARKQLAAIEPK